MKSATFQYKSKLAIISGTVTLKGAGAVSISLNQAKHYSSAERYNAKILANQIVKADFNHPAVIKLTESNDKLVEMIKLETAEMKEKYLKLTADGAREEFAGWQNCLKRNEKEWYEAFDIKWREVILQGKKCIEPDPNEYHRKALYKMRNARERIGKDVKKGIEAHLEKQKALAIMHYEYCTEKLGDRIMEQGMDEAKLKVTKGYVGVNLELTITDGTKTVRAWTIIAEGEIQKAHYRYLIK